MRLGTKTQTQTATSLNNFKGGLNTTASEEMIDATQTSVCINMQPDSVTGKLQTVFGTVDLIDFSEKLGKAKITAAVWDNINDVLLFFCNDLSIYAVNRQKNDAYKVGELTGEDDIVCASWEDGILIASGGRLQYGKTKLTANENHVAHYSYKISTIPTSPSVCRTVFIRSGRVVVFDDEDTLYYSAVGDEEDWTQDSNDPSSSLFAQVGYKAGGRLIAAYPLSSCIVLIKDNGLCYRLINEYPDWEFAEVGREIYCKNATSLCTTDSSKLIMYGLHSLYSIEPTQTYGELRPSKIGQQIAKELQFMPPDTKLRYVPPLNQIWFITGTQYVLVLDCNSNAFFQRYFNNTVVDILSDEDDVYIVKENKICTIDSCENGLYDNGEPLPYRAKFKTEVASNKILVKKAYVSVTPLMSYYDNSNATMTIGKLDIDIPKRIIGETKDIVSETQSLQEPLSPYIGNKDTEVFLSESKIAVGSPSLIKVTSTFRDDRVRITLKGEGFPLELNYIAYDKVEV